MSSYVINPKTSRPVKAGSKTWIKLVKEGLVDRGDYKDPNEIYDLQETDDIETKKQEIDETLPNNIQAVRGRGKHSGKLVKRAKQPTTKDVVEFTAKKASKIIRKCDGDELEKEIERMILEDLIKPTKRKYVEEDLEEQDIEEEEFYEN